MSRPGVTHGVNGRVSKYSVRRTILPSRTSIAMAKSKSMRLPSAVSSAQERRLADRDIAVHGQVPDRDLQVGDVGHRRRHAVADRVGPDQHLGEERILVAPVVGEQVGDALRVAALPRLADRDRRVACVHRCPHRRDSALRRVAHGLKPQPAGDEFGRRRRSQLRQRCETQLAAARRPSGQVAKGREDVRWARCAPGRWLTRRQTAEILEGARLKAPDRWARAGSACSGDDRPGVVLEPRAGRMGMAGDRGRRRGRRPACCA